MIFLERIFFYLFGVRFLCVKRSRRRTVSYYSGGRKVVEKEDKCVRFRSVSWSIFRFL